VEYGSGSRERAVKDGISYEEKNTIPDNWMCPTN
jgi:hypothetical protein